MVISVRNFANHASPMNEGRLPRLEVVLVEPEIPPNTGNVARLCAATRSPLHLVHPLGFSTEDRYLKRAGLDYWDQVEVIHHESISAFLEACGHRHLILFSKRATRPHTEAPFQDGSMLLFGKETEGLPAWLLEEFEERCHAIPMWGQVRSLNLSTAVGIVVYEGYRQLMKGFGPWRQQPGSH